MGLSNSSQADVLRDVSYLRVRAAEVAEIKHRMFGDVEEV